VRKGMKEGRTKKERKVGTMERQRHREEVD
jgi:hypothetical protein